MLTRKSFLQLGLIVFFLLFSANGYSASKMPSFALPNVMSGEDVNSGKYEGKALFVTFFATWCPPCIDEIPTLIKLQKKYGRDGFSVLGLSVDQGGTKALKRLIVKKKINYPVLLADSLTMQKFGGVYGIPVSFLINKNGTVVKKYTGYQPLSVLEKDLKQIL